MTGRGRPWIRGFVCGLMTSLGGLGHTLSYFMPQVQAATAVAVAVVRVELGVIGFPPVPPLHGPLLAEPLDVHYNVTMGRGGRS